LRRRHAQELQESNGFGVTMMISPPGNTAIEMPEHSTGVRQVLDDRCRKNEIEGLALQESQVFSIGQMVADSPAGILRNKGAEPGQSLRLDLHTVEASGNQAQLMVQDTLGSMVEVVAGAADVQDSPASRSRENEPLNRP
jgi:hypothetical protein